MEQVFDFREFVLMLFRRCRVVLLLALAFALLGGGFGFLTGGRREYKTTEGASVTLQKAVLESAPLADTMKSIDAIIGDGFFYNGLIDDIRTRLGEDSFRELAGGKSNPKLSALKEVLSVYTKGNLVLVDAVSENAELSAAASRAALEFVLERLPQLNTMVSLTQQPEQVIRLWEQEGGSRMSKTLKFGVLGLGGGLVLGILGLFFFSVFDLRVRSGDDLKRFGLPVLGGGAGDAPAFRRAAIAVAAMAKQKGTGGLSVLVAGENGQKAAAGLRDGLAALGIKAAWADAAAGFSNESGAAAGNQPEQAAAWIASRQTGELLVVAGPPAGQDVTLLLAASCGIVLLAEARKISRTDEIEAAIELLRGIGVEPDGFLLL